MDIQIRFDFTGIGYRRRPGVYFPPIFKQETVEGFARRFKQVVCAVTRAPGSKISGIEIITREEKQRLLEEFNDTERVYPEDKLLHELFEEQAERTPDNIALVGAHELHQLHEEGTRGLAPLPVPVSVTYKELNKKADGLARVLIEKGVLPDTIVGILANRSIEMIVGILGILKAGGAYLPIDPDYPGERINYMLTDGKVKYLVKKSKFFGDITVGDDVDVIFISHPHLSPAPTTILSSSSTLTSTSTCQVSPANLAYIIYTSGTTGRPKGVMVEHGSAVNTLVCRKEEYQMNGDDISLQLFPYSFDGFVTSFFTPIISGSPVVLLSDEEIKNIGKITAAIVKHKVTHFLSVPSLYSAIIESLTPGQASKLKIVTLAGERVGTNLLKNTIAKNSNMEISNEYGVTESAVMSTIYRHQQRDKVIKIGHPVWNTGIYILDRYNQPQPIGAAGELSLSGVGLARGYLNQPEMTAEKFLYVSYKSYRTYISNKIYKTGDLARWLSDGNIEFFGRLDHQVKIRGFRIETGEIESRLSTHQGVKDAVVIDRDNGKADKYLCAYFTAADVGSTPDSPALTDYLAERLPAFMIPAYFVLLNKLPLTPNGKLDRKALPAPVIGAAEEYIAPADDIEKKLVNIWADVLSIEKKAVGVKDNFFDLGGNSLKAMQVHSKIGNEFSKDIPAVMLFKYTTIRSFAANVIQEQNQVSTSRGDRSEARDRGRDKLKKLKRKVMEK
jgi:amino acid adenylation domain-containing protein